MAVQINYEIEAMIFMLAATLVFSHQRHLRVYRSSLFFWLMLLGVILFPAGWELSCSLHF